VLTHGQVVALYERGVDHPARAAPVQHGLNLGQSADNSFALDANQMAVLTLFGNLTVEKTRRKDFSAARWSANSVRRSIYAENL